MRCPRNVSIHFVLCKLSHSSRRSNRLCRSDIQCQAVTDPLLRLDQKNRLHARVTPISTPLRRTSQLYADGIAIALNWNIHGIGPNALAMPRRWNTDQNGQEVAQCLANDVAG